LQTFAKGDVMFDAQHPGAEFYVIIDGDVHLSDIIQNEQLCKKKRNDFIGIGTLVNKKRIVKGVCETPVTAMALKRSDLNEYVAKNASMKPIVLPLMGFNPVRILTLSLCAVNTCVYVFVFVFICLVR
jgi:signal-transduction protein with cAMP-binding, CBS, and nucleotidyltransferase domain